MTLCSKSYLIKIFLPFWCIFWLLLQGIFVSDLKSMKLEFKFPIYLLEMGMLWFRITLFQVIGLGRLGFWILTIFVLE